MKGCSKLKIRARAHEIIDWAKSYGIVLELCLNDRHLHVASVGDRRGTWMEKETFKKVNRFNERVDSKNRRDSW